MLLECNGYLAEITRYDGDKLIHGRAINTRAVLRFAGRNIEELRAAFAKTVADYREWCALNGKEPEKPFNEK